MDQPTEEAILQISGAGHWFLEGWIGDSGSAVTALSCRFYQTLLKAGAPVGVLRPTDRRLRGANGSPITISGCSSCMVSFLGLRTEFPVLVCELSTDAIIGTDTLGSILPHTLDIKNGLLFTDGGVSLQLHRRDAALSGRVWDIVRFRHALKRCCTVRPGQWAAGRSRRAACWRDSRCLQRIQAWWIHPDGEFQCWCPISARKP